jgi:hypothetical protein
MHPRPSTPVPGYWLLPCAPRLNVYVFGAAGEIELDVPEAGAGGAGDESLAAAAASTTVSVTANATATATAAATAAVVAAEARPRAVSLSLALPGTSRVPTPAAPTPAAPSDPATAAQRAVTPTPTSTTGSAPNATAPAVTATTTAAARATTPAPPFNPPPASSLLSVRGDALERAWCAFNSSSSDASGLFAGPAAVVRPPPSPAGSEGTQAQAQKVQKGRRELWVFAPDEVSTPDGCVGEYRAHCGYPMPC